MITISKKYLITCIVLVSGLLMGVAPVEAQSSADFSIDQETYQIILASVSPELRPLIESVLGSSVVVGTPAVGQSAQSFDRTLRMGMTGDDVALMQQKLNHDMETRLPVDGVFTPATSTVLQAFQLKHGLETDGVAGPKVFAELASVPVASKYVPVPVGAQNFASEATRRAVDLEAIFDAFEDIETSAVSITLDPTVYMASFTSLFREDAELAYTKYSGDVKITAKEDCSDGYPCDAQSDIFITTENTQDIFSGDVEFGVEVRTIEEDIYFKIAETDYLNQLISLDPSAEGVSDFIGTWIHLNLSDIAELLGVTEEDIQDLFQSDQEIDEELQEVLEAIKDAILAHEPIKSARFVGSETIEGATTDHYIITFDAEELVRIMLAVYQEMGVEGAEEVTEEEIQDFVDEIQDQQDIEAEHHVWIGRSDNIPYRWMSKITAPQQPESFMYGNMSIIIDLLDINEPVHVRVPRNTTPFAELVEFLEEV